MRRTYRGAARRRSFRCCHERRKTCALMLIAWHSRLLYTAAEGNADPKDRIAMTRRIGLPEYWRVLFDCASRQCALRLITTHHLKRATRSVAWTGRIGKRAPEKRG